MMTTQRATNTILPYPTKLGLNRVEAADFIGVGTTKFDEMVNDGRMPPPKKIDGRKVWDVRALSQAFDHLPSNNVDDPNPWDM